jgi:hypothetical protein
MSSLGLPRDQNALIDERRKTGQHYPQLPERYARLMWAFRIIRRHYIAKAHVKGRACACDELAQCGFGG